MKREKLIFGLGVALLGASACGVKGPPLPPVADTPAASDRASVSAADPAPSPTPSPIPSARSKRKKTR